MLRMDEHGPGGPVSKIRKRIWGGSLHVNWNSGGEIYFVNMFRVVPCFYNIMMPESFRNFMESRCMTAGVPIGSTQTAFMLSAVPIYRVN